MMNQFRLHSTRLLGEQYHGDNSTFPFKCGKSDKRLTMCLIDQQNCERSYSLYLPTSLCGEHNNTRWRSPGNSESRKIEIVPIVFAIHCYYCTRKDMSFWYSIAEEYSFVLVIPDGLHKSFNAKICCGYALENKVDDVGFFRNIITDLVSQYDFVSEDVTYATGYSNGGYMAMYASSLFRAVAPISGYQYDEDYSSITSHVSTGIFMQHAKDDKFVRFNGCCSNSTEPTCCCDISTQSQTPIQCTSVTQAYDRWAEQVNHCPLSVNDSNNSPSYSDEALGIVCHTRQGCQANTTLCVYERGGHAGTRYTLTNEIASFFARDACEGYGSSIWLESSRECSCTSQKHAVEFKSRGLYCLSTVEKLSLRSISSRYGVHNSFLTLIMVLFGAAFFYRHCDGRLRNLHRRCKNLL